MTCAEVQRVLSAYLDGELGDEVRRAVASHLERCETCRKEYEILARTVKMIRSLSEVPWGSGGGELPGGAPTGKPPSRSLPRQRDAREER